MLPEDPEETLINKLKSDLLVAVSLSEIIAIQRQLRRIIKYRRDVEKANAEIKVRRFAKSLGFTVEELFDIPHENPNKRWNKRKNPVKHKYRNPNNYHQTWTGRGIMPVWLRDLITAGHKKEDFLIKDD